MTLKLKSTTNELWKGWKLAWYHHFTHIACSKKLRGLKSLMRYFVYKMDNLFRSIRVSDENSFVTKEIHFFNLITTPDFLWHSLWTIRSHVINFQPCLPSLAIFHAFNDLFWAKWPWNWKAVQINSEKLETMHGVIISPM